MEKLRLNIDGREVTGYKGQTILEVALENNISIPTFCYDKRMDTYGSCGICVVEAEGTPKLLRSCATEISEGMVIKTNTKRVLDSRKVNLELMLSQHTGDCRAPCVMACPAQTDCQGYVGLIANGEFDEAMKLIKSKIPLAASIGRVCPHPCETACRRKLVDESISILNLKRFAADIDLSKPEPYLPELSPPSGKAVAVIGGGPGGLSAAYYLAELGHKVTVYDAMQKMGGMLRYGIPEYRLPKAIVDKEAALIEKMGVTFKNNIKIGADITFDSLKKSYDAVIVAIGAWTSVNLRCPGAELEGVYGGIDFLRRVVSNETVPVGKRVAVVGGGNTAMDACRTAVRLGAEEVYNIYRRTKAEMPAEEIEITEAEEEGVIFKYLVNPIEVIGENEKVVKMRLQKMRLGEPDKSGRRSPEPIEGEEEIIEVDTVIAALGQGVDHNGLPGVELTKWNTVIADDLQFTTNVEGVFAIGDCINNGASIAIEAIGNAKNAAYVVDGFLSGKKVTHTVPYRVVRDDLTEDDFADFKKEPRSHLQHLSPEARRDNFLEMSKSFSAEDAIRDAKRCLECGCHDFFECKLIDLANCHGVDPDRFKESVPKTELRDEHPFILRDPNKCILCGLCVRMCDEIVGSTALGLVNRGFDSLVLPAFEKDLCNTTCVSCGQCISVCPTGALQERQPFLKSIPLETKKTASICGMCSVGCSMQIESTGNMLIKTTPDKERGVNNGVMCARGRFGMNFIQRDGRLTAPLIRKDGTLTPVSWYDAFVYTAKKMESSATRGKTTAVAIGQTFTVEDADAVIKLAKDVLGSEVFSFSNRKNGLADVLGYDGSPNTLEEVIGTDCCILFGSGMLNNPVILSKLRYAAKKGTNIIVVSSGETEFNLPCTVIAPQETTNFIKMVIKALIESGVAPKNAEGFDALKDSLKNVTANETAQKLSEKYKSAKKAMILFAASELSAEAATEIANLAVVAGHIGSPRDGIFMLRQASGSQFLADLGVTAANPPSETKALMVFGEENVELPPDLEFLMVQDTHMTKTAESADVVFPMMVYPELCGTFVNTERRLQKLNKAVDAPIEYTTAQLASEIAAILERSISETELARLYPNTETGNSYPAPVLYTDGFCFDDRKAKLQVLPESPLKQNFVPTSSLLNAVLEKIPVPNTAR